MKQHGAGCKQCLQREAAHIRVNAAQFIYIKFKN